MNISFMRTALPSLSFAIVMAAVLGSFSFRTAHGVSATIAGPMAVASMGALSDSTVSTSVARRVVGYFPLWVRNGGYTENDIDFSVVNVVAHFSIVARVDGSIEIPDWGPFPDPALIGRTHAAGATIVLVVGGDHEAAKAGFAGMAAQASTRAIFITNLMRLVTTNGYDGVDLDWEFPEASDTGNLTALVGELRAALGKERTLSLAAPATDWFGHTFDLNALMPNLDWIGAMTYALSGASWSDHADHNAALFSSRDGETSVDASTSYYLGRGVPASKLLIGLPFYGQRFDNASSVHQPLSGKLGGAVDYPEITRLAGQGWTSYRDPTAEVPYLIRTDGIGVISYDDATSITAKCRYETDRGLGGVIIWHLSKDEADSTQPLLQATRNCR